MNESKSPGLVENLIFTPDDYRYIAGLPMPLRLYGVLEGIIMSPLRPHARNTNKSRISRSINRSTILEMIRTSGPIGRVQIADKLAISLPTVMRAVDDLIAEDLVKFSGQSESTGGRPSSLLELNSKNNIVIGIDLGGPKFYGAAADLSGDVQQELSISPEKSGNVDYVDILIKLIEEILYTPRPPEQKVRGVGVGVPGITLTPEGVVAFAPSKGWRDLPLQEILRKHFEIPIFVENDVNLAALGELSYGVGKGCRNLVTITVGTGIGAGIIIDGALYRGFNQAAGEIGYTLPGTEFLGKRFAGQFGALESMASVTGIVDQARMILDSARKSYSLEELTSEYVFEATRRDEAWAQQVLDKTIDYLSVAIANISAILDPDVIIFGGGMAHSADLLIDPILKRLEGSLLFPPRLVVSQLGFRAAVMGAIMLILNITTDHVVVKYFS